MRACRRAGAQDITTLRGPRTQSEAQRSDWAGDAKALLCSIAKQFTPARLPKQSRLDAGFALPTHSASRAKAAKEEGSLARRLPTNFAWETCKRRDRRGDVLTVLLRSDLAAIARNNRVIGNQSSSSDSFANVVESASEAFGVAWVRFVSSAMFCVSGAASRVSFAGCVAACTCRSFSIETWV